MKKVTRAPATQNLLGKAQTEAENAAKALRLAQVNFNKAEKTLQGAEARHTTAIVGLSNAVSVVKGNVKVAALGT